MSSPNLSSSSPLNEEEDELLNEVDANLFTTISYSQISKDANRRHLLTTPQDWTSIISSTACSSSSSTDSPGKKEPFLVEVEEVNNSDCEDIAIAKPVKKIRNQYRIVPRAMHVLRQDSRRQYMTMFVNVMNSYDDSLTKAFVKKFASRSIFFVGDLNSVAMRQAKVLQLPTLTPRVVVRGMANVAGFLTATWKMTPDRVIRMENVQLKTFSNSECCELTASLILTGTYLYVVTAPSLAETVEQQLQRMSLQEKHKDSGSSGNTSSNASMSGSSSSSVHGSLPNKRTKKETTSSRSSSITATSNPDVESTSSNTGPSPARKRPNQQTMPNGAQMPNPAAIRAMAAMALAKGGFDPSSIPPDVLASLRAMAGGNQGTGSAIPAALSALMNAGGNQDGGESPILAVMKERLGKMQQLMQQQQEQAIRLASPSQIDVKQEQSKQISPPHSAASGGNSSLQDLLSNAPGLQHIFNQHVQSMQGQSSTSSTNNPPAIDPSNPLAGDNLHMLQEIVRQRQLRAQNIGTQPFSDSSPSHRAVFASAATSARSPPTDSLSTFFSANNRLSVPVEHTMRVCIKIRVNQDKEIEWIHFVQEDQ